MWCFSGNCLMRGCFCWNRHVGGCFARNRHVVFLEAAWKKGMCCFARTGVWENRDIWKGVNITRQMVDNAVWHWFTLPSSLGFADAGLCSSRIITLCDFIDRNSLKNLWYSGSFLPLPPTWANWQRVAECSAIAGLWMVFASGSSYHCWFIQTELLLPWQETLEWPPKNYF